jgi:hypothetical protein
MALTTGPFADCFRAKQVRTARVTPEASLLPRHELVSCREREGLPARQWTPWMFGTFRAWEGVL